MAAVENYTGCYLGLHALWKNNKKKDFAVLLQRNLECAANPYKLTLVCIKLCPDLFKSKNSGMAVAIALELQTFLSKQERSYSECLTEQMQIEVFHLAVRQKNTGMMRVLTKVYQLADVREQLIPKLHEMVVKQQYKEVCTFATLVDLQNCFSTEELVIPLFCLDRLCIADEFLASSPKHQEEIVKFIDSIIGHEPEASQMLKKFNITDIGRFKSNKVLSNVLSRLLKRFQLDMSICPHLYKRRSVGGLRYLFYKYYIEKGLQTTAFHSLVEDAIQETPELKFTLIDLFIEYCEPQSAVPYVYKYQMKCEDLPQIITDAMMSCLSIGQTESCQNVTDIPSEECWDEDANFYSLSIPYENIIFVNSVEDFEKCMTELSKNSVIGLDSEWKPTFGIGSGEQVALMQLATGTRVYLLDLVSLQPLLNTDHWMQLGNLFTDAYITKLGYGIKSDFRILARLHTELKKALTTTKNVIDFDQKKSVLLEALPEIFSYSPSSYKGLSDLVYRCFGKPLNKNEQFSNWANRPLTTSQKLYAGLDALCLIDIYDYLNMKAQDIGCGDWQNLKTRTPQQNPKAEKKNKKKELSPDKIPVIPRMQGPILAKDFCVICDTMLQGLAKKLRLCGVDAVALENGQSSDDCISYYENEQRYVLSRGAAYRRLAKFIPAEYVYHVESEGARDQLIEVMKSFSVQMTPGDFLSRCVKCNCSSYIHVPPDLIEDLQKSAGTLQDNCWVECIGGLINLGSGCTDAGVKIDLSKISSPIIEKNDIFYACRKCGKCYWDGEHENGSFRDVVQQFIVSETVCDKLHLVDQESVEALSAGLKKQLDFT